MAWLELVSAECRKVPVPPDTRAAILERWKPSSHFGHRAAESIMAHENKGALTLL